MSNHPPSGAHGADAGGSLPELSAHKRAVQRHFDRLAPEMERWRRKSWYYHQELRRFCRDTIPPGQSVLEVGCGTGGLLAAVDPREGVGVDLSPRMVERARAQFPYLTWLEQDAEAPRPRASVRLRHPLRPPRAPRGHLARVQATTIGLVGQG